MGVNRRTSFQHGRALAAVAFLASLVSAATAQSSVVAEEAPISAASADQRDHMSPEELGANLRKLGYFTITSDTVTLFVAPGIWQQAEIDKMIRLYTELGKSARLGGGFDYSTDPDLYNAAEGLASSFGCTVDPSGSGQLIVNRSYTCECNGKVVQLSGSSRQQPYDPSKVLRPADLNKKRPPSAMLGVRIADHFSFSCYGPKAFDRPFQQEQYKRAIQLIDDHLKAYYAKRAPLLAGLIKKIEGYNSGDYYGRSFGQLPPDMQDQLRSLHGSQILPNQVLVPEKMRMPRPHSYLSPTALPK